MNLWNEATESNFMGWDLAHRTVSDSLPKNTACPHWGVTATVGARYGRWALAFTCTQQVEGTQLRQEGK